MKEGRDIQDLAAEVKRQMETKKDYIADTRHLHFFDDRMKVGGDVFTNALELTHHAHKQVADRLKIPMAYYNRMRDENPTLLAQNVNTWFTEKPEKRMVRTLDNKVRAFVSDRFKVMDNYDFLQAILPPIIEGGLQVESCEVTDLKLYIKAIIPSMTAEVVRGESKKGDVVQGALVWSNSEVGCGALSVTAAIKVIACSNLAMFRDVGLKKMHIGAKKEIEGVQELLTDETKSQTEIAAWMQVKDVAKALATDRTHFDRNVAKLQHAVEDKMEISPVEVVENAVKTFSIDKGYSESIVDYLFRGGDLNKYGLHNAVTRVSQDIAGYDEATEMERIGGKIIELPRTEWRRIAA